MYMRLVQAIFKSDSLPMLSRLYAERVIPTLQKVEGCLYATLIQSVNREDECISMTLWKEKKYADVYEQSGVFSDLLKEAKPYLADSTEWKIHLSEDLKLVYEPVAQEPEIKTYTVAVKNNSQGVPTEKALFVRIVSPQIREGSADEFKKLYQDEILPALRQVKGCRYAYLTENVKEKHQVISVTIWDSRIDAEEYEQSGLFDLLLDKVKHTFSEVYQWKMKLEKESSGFVATGEEETVEGFNVVAGKSFF